MGPYIRVYIKAFVFNPGYPGLPTAGVTNVVVPTVARSYLANKLKAKIKKLTNIRKLISKQAI